MGLRGDLGSPAQRLPWCLLAACIWALPHLGWGSRPGVGSLGFVALAGSGLVSLALVVLALPRRSSSDAEPLAANAILLGLGLALVPWSVLAYWLAVATHHRPLGAVTYAVGAACTAAVGIAIARRVLTARSGRRVLLGTAIFCAAIGVIGLATVAARGFASDGALRSALPDLGLGIVLALLAAFVPVAATVARLARVALFGCLCLWAVTLGLMRFEPDVRATVKSVPVIAGVLGLAVQ